MRHNNHVFALLMQSNRKTLKVVYYKRNQVIYKTMYLQFNQKNFLFLCGTHLPVSHLTAILFLA